MFFVELFGWLGGGWVVYSVMSYPQNECGKDLLKKFAKSRNTFTFAPDEKKTDCKKSSKKETRR